MACGSFSRYVGAMPAPIPPDRKDWTWVLQHRCPQCGLDVSQLTTDEVADRAEAAGVEWMQVLTSNPGVLLRPEPLVWSPLEYGAHVRDVYALFDARLALMLVEDEPTFDNWDQDEAAENEDYATQDPEAVADELLVRSEAIVTRIRGLQIDQLERLGRRSDGAEFTVTTFLRYFLHDVIHHLWDVTGQQDGVEL